MPVPPPSAMSADEFRTLVKAAGLTLRGAAGVIGVRPDTASRWATARASITAAYARLIRERIKPA